jgi:hypothetical protein
MSKEIRPVLYHYIRKRWFSQLVSSCNDALDRKGKDPILMFWKAFGMGMNGEVQEALQDFDAFHARKDLHFPVNSALLYFNKKLPQIDRDTVRTLSAELPIAEEVAKEAGIVLAARFQLFVGNFSESRRLCKKILEKSFASNSGLGGGSGTGTSTVFEAEASVIDLWCQLEEALLSNEDVQTTMMTIIAARSRINAEDDPDALLLLYRAKAILGADYEGLNFLNLVSCFCYMHIIVNRS